MILVIRSDWSQQRQGTGSKQACFCALACTCSRVWVGGCVSEWRSVAVDGELCESSEMDGWGRRKEEHR